jgi:hypothetical protein
MDPEKARSEVPSSGRVDIRTLRDTTTPSDPPIEPPDVPKTGFSGKFDLPDTPEQGPKRTPTE